MTPSGTLKLAALCALGALPCVAPASAAALSNAPRFLSAAAPSQAVDFAVHLPLRNEAELERLVEVQSDPSSPMFRHWLTPAQFRAAYAPSAAARSAAEAALRAEGFVVTQRDTQLIHVRGTAASVERAFAVHLGNVRDTDGTIRLAPREALTVPHELTALNATVVGLAYTIKPKPQSQLLPQNRYGATGGYWFDDLKQAYDYPSYQTLDGSGVTIATVGYSDFSSTDAKAYFNHELLGGTGSLAKQPIPKHYRFPGSYPFNPNFGVGDEADLDVQQSNGSAPGATVIGIAAPATQAEGFLYAYSYIVDSNYIDIVSTSYGECELFYLPAYNGGTDYTSILKAYHEIFVQGNAQGITFLFSSGDDSGRSCPPPGYLLDPGQGKVYQDVAGTSIWSDDPNVTSVGGTNLVTVPNPNPTASPRPVTSSAYVSENANADIVEGLLDIYGTGNYISNELWGSGGGTSVIFPAPAYQAGSNTGSTMRVSPDVSMHMGGCPFYISPITGGPVKEKCNPNDSFDYAVIGGQFAGLIGTSASSPEFAGLLAVKEQQLGGGRLGNANVYIYKMAANEATNHAFHQGIPGFNGVVATHGALGYNPIVGNGTPDARYFIGVPFGAAAGDPQTPTNP